MSIVVPSLSDATLTMMLSDTEFQLMRITARMQQLNARSGEVAKKYSDAMSYALKADDDNQTDIDLLDYDTSFLNFEPETAAIHAQEKAYDLEKQRLETKHKELTQMKESNDKLLDQGAKDFKSGSSSS